jgi:hypothetical protein
MFGGSLCEGNNHAFAWPVDTGCRAKPATGTFTNAGGGHTFPIHLILREALSGTMNTTEFSEFRIYGSTLGSGDNGQNAVTSQERNVIVTNGAGDNPLNAKACSVGQSFDMAAWEGNRTRAIGTGEEINGASGVGGVLNTADSIGYTFFSFNNVSKLAAKTAFGYTMIDAVDGLFSNYNGGDYGQPAQTGTGTTWGELPQCTPGGTTTAKPDCRAIAIWNGNKQDSISAVSTAGTTSTYTYTITSGPDLAAGDPIFITGFTGADVGDNGFFIIAAVPGSGGAGTFDVTNSAGTTNAAVTATANAGVANTFPHLRDGTYHGWNILRVMCETSTLHCLNTDDALGAEALVLNMQDDIHFNHLGGVPDLLPFSDDDSFGPGNHLGDVGFVREHFAYGKALSVVTYPTPTSTHLSGTQVGYQGEPCSGGAFPGTPNQAAPGGPGECGGDAGGFIVAPGSASTGVLQ